MSQSKNTCQEVSELLAWGKTLTDEQQLHIVSCEHCTQAALAFEQLDSMAKNDEVDIPANFASSVMKEIEKRNAPAIIDRMQVLLESFAIRLAMGGASFLFAFAAH
jgi:hypothetical protein